ncbi:MAG: CsgG/HfaB family protein, partial [Pseudomonadota bacterium]
MRRVEKNRFLPRNLRRLLPGVLAAFLVSITGYTPGVSADSHGGGLFSNIFKQPGTDTRVTSQGGPSINEARREAYNGPKARIAVARFTDKTRKGWWNRGIGDGMADQLTTALFQTNRYIVLERETLNDVMREQDLVTAGRVSQQTGAPTGQIEGAELLITGAVTEFEGNSGGGGGSIGGGLFGDAGKIVGRLARSYRTAHMAIDLRVIDARTSRILAATSVEGEASDVNIGAALLGRTGGAALGGALSGWKNTPIEKALRQCIQDAVNFVVSQTPQQF